MKPPNFISSTVFIAIAFVAIALTSGCGSLNKALLSPPQAVVETKPDGGTVTNYVYTPSVQASNTLAIGEAVAPFLPPAQSQGLTAILGLAAGVLGAYAKYQGNKRRQETAELEQSLDSKNSVIEQLSFDDEKKRVMLEAVIKGVESSNSTDAKQAIEREARKREIAGALYEKVKEVTAPVS